jgi:hypothetical protein
MKYSVVTQVEKKGIKYRFIGNSENDKKLSYVLMELNIYTNDHVNTISSKV